MPSPVQQQLQELCEKQLGALDLVAILIDGIHLSKQVLVVALGIETSGEKHVLGLWQWATENTTVVQELLEDLVARGLPPERRYLFELNRGQFQDRCSRGQCAWLGLDSPKTEIMTNPTLNTRLFLRGYLVAFPVCWVTQAIFWTLSGRRGSLLAFVLFRCDETLRVIVHKRAAKASLLSAVRAFF